MIKEFGSYRAVDELSGKTTVLNLVMGTLAPDRDRVKLAGFDQARTIASEWLARVNLAGAENKYTHERIAFSREKGSVAEEANRFSRSMRR